MSFVSYVQLEDIFVVDPCSFIVRMVARELGFSKSVLTCIRVIAGSILTEATLVSFQVSKNLRPSEVVLTFLLSPIHQTSDPGFETGTTLFEFSFVVQSQCFQFTFDPAHERRCTGCRITNLTVDVVSLRRREGQGGKKVDRGLSSFFFAEL